MFQNSPTSQRIWDYFNQKYGQMLSPVGLVKTCSVVSAKLDNPRLSVFCVAPSRQFKSRSSIEMRNVFKESQYLDLGSDFTIHALCKRYGKTGLDRKCLFVNDATLLFASKKANTKDRLVNAMAELLSEGKYTYGDRVEPSLVLKGRISVVMNMTTESFLAYESKLIGSTFQERFLTIFYRMSQEELSEIARERDQKIKMKFGKRLPSRRIVNVNISKNLKMLLIDYAKRFSSLSLRSFNSCHDIILALVRSHASLNDRKDVCNDDIELLKIIEGYLVNPLAPNEVKIIEYYRQGRSYKDISILLGKDPQSYKSYISRIIKKARRKGLVS